MNDSILDMKYACGGMFSRENARKLKDVLACMSVLDLFQIKRVFEFSTKKVYIGGALFNHTAFPKSIILAHSKTAKIWIALFVYSFAFISYVRLFT